MPLRLVFCGTPAYAVPTLNALVEAGHSVALVLSQPDKPVGREGILAPTPVKAAALARGIAVEQPTTLKRNDDLRLTLERLAPDAIVVVAYGRILPPWMLELPRLGCVNAHGSILPRWRGAAPIQWAIASGDTETGVTTMQMDAGLDTGGTLLRCVVPIGQTTTAPELFAQLAQESAALVVETLAQLDAGTLTATPQDSALATLAPLLTREAGLIDWSHPAREIDQRFRGFQPWPGAYTSLRGKKLIVHRMRPTVSCGQLAPGELEVRGSELFAQCGGASAVLLEEVQLEGKKRMMATEFLRGFQIRNGERLG